MAGREIIDAAVATVRGRLHQAGTEVTLDALRHQVKETFRKRVEAKLLDPALDPALDSAASYQRFSKMCELASSICHNTDEICKLADEVGANLGRDDWAKQKCGNAAISCQQGQMRCCSCDGSQGSVLTP